MTSTSRRTSIDTVKCRPILRNKNQAFNKSKVKRMDISVSVLSPEAQHAMRMTKEDNLLEMSSATQSVNTNDGTEHDNGSYSNNDLGQQDVTSCNNGKDSRSNSRAPSLRFVDSRVRGPPVSMKMKASSSVSSGKALTPTFDSTRSLAGRSHSISDNADSCYNNSMIKCLNGVELSNCSNKDSEVQLNTLMDTTKTEQVFKQLQYSVDENMNEDNDKVNNVEINEEPKQTDRPDSFVLTLDQVLEKKSLNRLRGDITNTTNKAEPGTVRALDGGRLTNAQEVVVNVWHDDDRKLIFNDDDEESMSNARAVSEIRISLWMKYNEGFQPEDVIDDMYTRTAEDGNAVAGLSNDAKATRETSADKSCSDKVTTNVIRFSSTSKWQTTKTDVNNNSGVLSKSRYRSSNKLKENAVSVKRPDAGKAVRMSSLKKDQKS